MKTSASALIRRLSTSHLARRLTIGAAWSVVGTLIARLITLAGTVVIVRMLGAQEYGQLAVLQSTIVMASSVAGLGLGISATKFAAELKIRNPERLGRILALIERAAIVGGAVAAVLMAALSTAIAERILAMPQLRVPIVIGASAVFFGAIDGYQTGALLGFEAMRRATIGLVVSTVISIGLMLILTSHWGFLGTVWGLAFGSLVQCCVSRWQLNGTLRNANIRMDHGALLDELPVLRDFAVPAVSAGIMVSAAHWICHAMLVNTSRGASEMAVLGIASQWFQAVVILPAVAGRIILPVLTDTVAAKNPQQTRNVLRAGIVVNLLLASPIALMIGVASPWIMGMYGATFVAEWPTLAVMIIAATISALLTPMGHAIAAQNAMWVGWGMNFGWALIYVTSTYFMLDAGALGVAGAGLVAYVFHGVWVTAWARRALKAN